MANVSIMTCLLVMLVQIFPLGEIADDLCPLDDDKYPFEYDNLASKFIKLLAMVEQVVRDTQRPESSESSNIMAVVDRLGERLEQRLGKNSRSAISPAFLR
ncbi:uncharacterized protein DNG_01475 [Cephalotrichum gorgonifer]|uniref:Uncharacterized protein n=1 Tax=Cephalotrichum gorgonifer TaxID=2041049 RepID=A0AAE8MTA5_9PEZI|nr:uncharacterized protein DNG_01475 [Cephalotrichum gorgonifer]